MKARTLHQSHTVRMPQLRFTPSMLKPRVPLATLGPLLALLAACAFFASQSDRFLSGGNLSLMTLAQKQVTAQNAAGQNQGAENADQQSPRVALLFFFNREWFSF